VTLLLLVLGAWAVLGLGAAVLFGRLARGVPTAPAVAPEPSPVPPATVIPPVLPDVPAVAATT